MVKTINYFFDSIIPSSTGEEPDENQRKCMLEKWESKTRDMALLKSGSDQAHEDEKRSPGNVYNRRSSASEEGASLKRHSIPISRPCSPSSLLWISHPELSPRIQKDNLPSEIKSNIQFISAWVLEHPEVWDEAIEVFSNLVEEIKSKKLVAEQQQRILAGGAVNF